jgi:hypothetical protein
MITNGIDFVFKAHTTLSDRAISGDEQFNFELVAGQIGGDSHFSRGALTIHYNVPAVSMDHSFVCHSYQPLRPMRLLPATGRKYFMIVHHCNTKSTRYFAF